MNVTFRGGPLDGETHVAPREWPLPEVFALQLHAEEEGIGLNLGGYRQVVTSESDALYQWEVDYNELPEGARKVEVGADGRPA